MLIPQFITYIAYAEPLLKDNKEELPLFLQNSLAAV